MTKLGVGCHLTKYNNQNCQWVSLGEDEKKDEDVVMSNDYMEQ